jgi:predicted nuclease of predicted toxin-antitoxin system
MLLLDHNLPHQLRELLADFGIEAETARYRGWAELRNGELTLTSYQAGFRTILTRDVGFATSASKSISKVPEMAIIIVRIPQRSWREYAEAFRSAWTQAPFRPVPGQVIWWP